MVYFDFCKMVRYNETMSKNQTALYWREYRRKNLEAKKEIERKSRQRSEYKEARRAYMAEWRKNDRIKNPHKWIARELVKQAIKKGSLIRQPCVKCGELKSEAHHPDHTKPLEVIWLCRSHHGQEDFTKP